MTYNKFKIKLLQVLFIFFSFSDVIFLFAAMFSVDYKYMAIDIGLWKKEKTETVMAVDELLLRWEELEKKKKMMDELILELKKDVSSFHGNYPGNFTR